MPQMTSQAAQVVSPILTGIARGYKNSRFVGEELLPRINIPVRNAKVMRFGKEAFRTYINVDRAPGAEARTIQIGYASDPVALDGKALDALVPRELAEDAKTGPGIDLSAKAVRTVLDIMGLNREVKIANLVRNAGNYPKSNVLELTGKDRWDNEGSDPAAVLDDAKDTVRSYIGQDPNTLLLSPRVYKTLKRHPVIVDIYKRTTAKVLTAEMLADYFEVDKVILAKSVVLANNAPDSAPAQNVWGNDAILAYVPEAGTEDYMVPAFGYNYNLNNYPFVEAAIWDGNRRSWRHPVNEEYRPYITGAEGGFLLKSPAGNARGEKDAEPVGTK